MSNISFSQETKESLLKLDAKKKCCKRTFTDTTEAAKVEHDGSSLAQVFDKLRCDVCLREFIKAVFIIRGSVTDPQKSYHLDFSFTSEEDRDTVVNALEEAGFSARSATRKGMYTAYFKDNDTIGDLLAFLGATKSAFDMMNSKIVKEVRNNANRLVNCDTANIEKSLSASQKYVEAIEYIRSKGGLTALPSELREAAELRVTYIQASLNELALKCQPPISKSGMKHRLEKLLAHAEELKSGKRNQD